MGFFKEFHKRLNKMFFKKSDGAAATILPSTESIFVLFFGKKSVLKKFQNPNYHGREQP